MAISELRYAEIEEQIRQVYLTKFSTRLTDDTCQVADLDKAFNALMSYNADEYTDMLILDFGGGTSQPKQAFANIKWAWITTGVYMIRYHDDIETALRTVVSNIPTALQENPRLNGVADRAYVSNMGDATIGKLNDVSFYLIPFYIETLDRSVQL